MRDGERPGAFCFAPPCPRWTFAGICASFLLAQLPDGNAVFFRYYDPRVWRVYWPTCTPDEKAKWMEGVEEFIAEDG